MSIDAWITLGTLLVMLIGLVSDRVPHAAVVLGGMITLLVAGVIDTEAALAGFSNPAPITVAALYVLARAVQKTSALAAFTSRLLGNTATRYSGTRLVIPAASASAFFNNTPLVAMLIPDVMGWARRQGVAPSRFLLPLSYAAILGGVTTLIGTSTNLVVSGLLDDAVGEPLAIFEMTSIGLPVALAGLVVVLFVVPRLLPERLSAPERAQQEMREFVVEMTVDPSGPLAGKTVADAGLRDLRGVFLLRITRGDTDTVISPVAPDRRIDGGDRLTFVGRVDDIVDLQHRRGLRSSEEKHLLALDSTQHQFYEAVVSRYSPLVGQTLATVEFRGTYQAAVVAIHRDGQRIDAKLGDVQLRHGDTLLLLAGDDFRTQWRDRGDFLVVAPLSGEAPTASSKAPVVAVATAAMVLLAAFDVLPIVEGALVAAALMIVLRVVTWNEARDSIDLDVVLLICAAFGIGEAMRSTGLAQDIAEILVDTFDGFGTAGVVLGVVLATVVLTEVVTNNAAAVVMIPVALAAAETAGIDVRTMAIAVAIAASCSFVTPIGYQTNTMVYGPGGYRFVDYVRAGLPVTVVMVGTLTTLVALA